MNMFEILRSLADAIQGLSEIVVSVIIGHFVVVFINKKKKKKKKKKKNIT